MSSFLAAAQPVRPIVIEKGGTAWWVPFLIALGVALVAAVVSYWATWRFKQADVNRDSAIRAADLVDEAEQLVAQRAKYDAAEGGGAATVSRILAAAWIRARPLADADLNDRFQAARYFISDLQELRPTPRESMYAPGTAEIQEAHAQTSVAMHWLANAVANVRDALVPHLAAPQFIPRGKHPGERSFPTMDELTKMRRDDREGRALIDDLIAWRATGQTNQGAE